MTISDFIRVLRHSWILISVVTALGLAGGAALTFTTTPVYDASTKVFVSVQSTGSTPSDLVQGNSAAQQKVSSYLDVV